MKNLLSSYEEEGTVLFNKIKNSLVVQTNALLLFSIAFIIALWVFFYISQIHQQKEHNTARYFNAVTVIQPQLLNQQTILESSLSMFSLQFFTLPQQHTGVTVFEKGDKKRGFRQIQINDKNILHIYNSQGEIYLEDIHSDNNMLLIHAVFILLLIFQVVLYLKLSKSLKPLALLFNKLKNLQKGDLSPLQIESTYEELTQIIKSYNQAVSKLHYILDTREMFNKIFMHEMKMPIAKGMFYLKMEPSTQSHEKLQTILSSINSELEEFSQIEALISYQNKIDKTEHNFVDILEVAKKRAMANESDIQLINPTSYQLIGDKEFWILCLKNLIDNALKYADDKKLTIKCDNTEGISFINKGDALPVDISQEINQWKIDKTKRHKSSTGYGFGLFIIKNIVNIHNYTLEYNYDTNTRTVALRIV